MAYNSENLINTQRSKNKSHNDYRKIYMIVTIVITLNVNMAIIITLDVTLTIPITISICTYYVYDDAANFNTLYKINFILLLLTLNLIC